MKKNEHIIQGIVPGSIAEELELDTEWDDYYDGFTAYSQSQIDEAEEVKAIPVERLKDFRNVVVNMNSIAIIQRLDKLIEEVEE